MTGGGTEDERERAGGREEVGEGEKEEREGKGEVEEGNRFGLEGGK